MNGQETSAATSFITRRHYILQDSPLMVVVVVVEVVMVLVLVLEDDELEL